MTLGKWPDMEGQRITLATLDMYPSSIPCGPRLGPSWAKLGPKWAPDGPDWGPFWNAAWVGTGADIES